MGNYAKRDLAALEVAQRYRMIAIAEQIPGLDKLTWDRAFWLFCPRSGYRKITDVSWFHDRMKPGESVATFRERLWCPECKRHGGLTIIPAPHRLSNMGFERDPAKLALVVTEKAE